MSDIDQPQRPFGQPTHDRYEDLGFVRAVGDSELRRARDRELGRVVVLRVLHESLASVPRAVERFLEQARLAAQLDHPSIHTVLDVGRLRSGQPFIALAELRGMPIAEQLGSGSLRVAMRAFTKAVEAVAFAHDRGVVHGSLSPDTLLVGGRGEVLVTAWGMATESDPRVDVRALGAVLSAILQDRAANDAEADPLRAIARRATAARADERQADAAALLAELEDWLDQSPRAAKALQLVERAEALNPQALGLRRRAQELRESARHILARVPAEQGEEAKELGWSKEEQAELFEREAERVDQEAERLLYSAFNHAPGLAAAHRALAARYRAMHAVAEAASDAATADRAGALLRVHAGALPTSAPVRRTHFAYLKGTGALTLVTNPPAAEVELHRYEEHNRRLVWVAERVLGKTPLVDIPVPMGSYLLVIRAPGRVPVRYPVHIRRQEHWDGAAPGETTPHAIYLPREGELRKNDCYVPAGWFVAGGDRAAINPLQRRRLWSDGFILRRFPVTNRDYLSFLNDLVTRGREEEALRYVPRERQRLPDKPAAMIYGRRRDGSFGLRKDIDGDQWLKDWPVFMIDWASAQGYAAWFAEITNSPWRLPSELEWEKAARGVDGRTYPWGNWLDPSWCRMRETGGGRPFPAEVATHPVDASPYDVHGLGGNVRDWCYERYLPDGPLTPHDRVVVPPSGIAEQAEWDTERVARGGYWAMSAQGSRAATRYHVDAFMRSAHLGVRLARSL